MERLKIGIPGWAIGEESFGAGKAYLAHASLFGDVVILPPMRGILKGIDMILMPGGKDVSSYLYGQTPGFYNSSPDPFKEYFLQQNLDQYVKAGIPIWGTCLGFQQIIVHFGGYMEQNINLSAHGHSGEHRDLAVHPLVISPDYEKIEKVLLKAQNKRKMFKKEEHNNWLWTNSLHHQAVPVKGVPDCFDIIAFTDDGYVEAVKHKELPIMGAQFHVEEDYNELGMYLFEEIVKLAKHDKSGKKPERTNNATIAD